MNLKFVVDSNILMAALLKDSITRELIFDDRLELFAPEFSLVEIRKLVQQPRIRRRLHLREVEVSELIELIVSRVRFVPEKLFDDFIKQAMKWVTHEEDSPFMALSLALDAPLWSHDAELKEQKQVTVYSTQEVLRKLT